MSFDSYSETFSALFDYLFGFKQDKKILAVFYNDFSSDWRD